MRARPSPSPWAASAASSRWRWPRGGCLRYGGRRSGGWGGWWRFGRMVEVELASPSPNLHLSSTNLLSEQPSQFQRHQNGKRVAAQHEQAHHAVGAQRLASVAQVALRHPASIDQEELVAHRDPGLCAGAPRYDIIDHDVLEPRAPGGEPQPAPIEIARGDDAGSGR